MVTKNGRRFALLIDADNAQATLLPAIWKELDKYGVAIIRLIYGNFASPQMASWTEHLQQYAIEPIQIFPYTTGKNATDNALIIDAMDILHTSSDVNSFCIVSSDSDYTRLASRIRKDNLFVLGIGRKNTVEAFRNACNDFIFTETLQKKKASDDKAVQKNTPEAKAQQTDAPQTDAPKKKIPKKLATLFKKAFELIVEDNGWGQLSKFASSLRQIDPKFEPKTYGHSQLLKMLQKYPEMIELRKSGANNSIYYVRIKK